MKYEIIKGSEKDFDGAPEWCTHISKRESSGDLAWESADRAIKGNRWQWVGEYGAATYDAFVSGWPFTKIIAERRPITEPVWDGEGLPPVGVECEWLDNRETYLPVKIMYSSKDAVVIRGRSQAFNEDVDIPLDPVFEPARCKFRPIRSPEDVARDEAKAAIAELCRSSASNGHSADLIYDAIAAGKIPGITLATKPAKQSDSECEHKNTHTRSGGCACNDCGWTSW